MNVSKEESKNAQPQSSRNRQYDRNDSGFGWQSDQSDQESEESKIEIHDINPTDDKLDEPAHNIFLIADKQKFEILREEHLRNGTLFEDPEFPDTEESFFGLPKSKLNKEQKEKYMKITWLRPKDIVKLKDPSKEPNFVVDGYSRFDVKQGGLGDCWALVGMDNLTLHPHLFGEVVPDDQSFNKEKYAGIFHFKFWQFGKWIDVVVDDRLPTKEDGVLCYVRSGVDNEFWISLLEKAYAKLYGSYQALQSGKAYEAMQDFTGGVVEVFTASDTAKMTPQDIFTMILKAYERGSMISSSCGKLETGDKAELKDTYGLISSHAYSITSAKSIETSNSQEKRVHLLRLRNPWGSKVEWKKAWSDDDAERWQTVSKDVQKQIGFKADHDGEFWMSVDDFKTHFKFFGICHLNPEWLSKEESSKESSKKKKWHMSTIDGHWVTGVTAGGQDLMDENPQYQITLTEQDEDDKESKCTLIVSLMQKHRRAMRIAGNSFIGFYIYHLPDPDRISKPLNDMFFKSKPNLVGHTTKFLKRREVNRRFKFSPGTYCIIPCLEKSEQEGSFMLRIFTEKKSNMTEHDDDIRLEELANQKNKSGNQIGMRTSISLYDYEQARDKEIMEKFLKFGKKDLEINWHELKEILDSDMKKNTKGNGFSEDVCRSIVALADTDHSGKLDYEEFKKLWIDVTYWKEAFESEDKRKTGTISSYELREALLSTGYHVNNHILIDLMHRYGNKEHKFSFELFILCALKVKTMLALFNTKFDGKNHTANFRLDDFMEGTLYS